MTTNITAKDLEGQLRALEASLGKVQSKHPGRAKSLQDQIRNLQRSIQGLSAGAQPGVDGLKDQIIRSIQGLQREAKVLVDNVKLEEQQAVKYENAATEYASLESSWGEMTNPQGQYERFLEASRDAVAENPALSQQSVVAEAEAGDGEDEYQAEMRLVASAEADDKVNAETQAKLDEVLAELGAVDAFYKKFLAAHTLMETTVVAKKRVELLQEAKVINQDLKDAFHAKADPLNAEVEKFFEIKADPKDSFEKNTLKIGEQLQAKLQTISGVLGLHMDSLRETTAWHMKGLEKAMMSPLNDALYTLVGDKLTKYASSINNKTVTDTGLSELKNVMKFQDEDRQRFLDESKEWGGLKQAVAKVDQELAEKLEKAQKRFLGILKAMNAFWATGMDALKAAQTQVKFNDSEIEEAHDFLKDAGLSAKKIQNEFKKTYDDVKFPGVSAVDAAKPVGLSLPGISGGPGHLERGDNVGKYSAMLMGIKALFTPVLVSGASTKLQKYLATAEYLVKAVDKKALEQTITDGVEKILNTGGVFAGLDKSGELVDIQKGNSTTEDVTVVIRKYHVALRALLGVITHGLATRKLLNLELAHLKTSMPLALGVGLTPDRVLTPIYEKIVKVVNAHRPPVLSSGPQLTLTVDMLRDPSKVTNGVTGKKAYIDQICKPLSGLWGKFDRMHKTSVEGALFTTQLLVGGIKDKGTELVAYDKHIKSAYPLTVRLLGYTASLKGQLDGVLTSPGDFLVGLPGELKPMSSTNLPWIKSVGVSMVNLGAGKGGELDYLLADLKAVEDAASKKPWEDLSTQDFASVEDPTLLTKAPFKLDLTVLQPAKSGGADDWLEDVVKSTNDTWVPTSADTMVGAGTIPGFDPSPSGVQLHGKSGGAGGCWPQYQNVSGGADMSPAVAAGLAGVSVGLLSGVYILGFVIVLLCVVLMWMANQVASRPVRTYPEYAMREPAPRCRVVQGGAPEGYAPRKTSAGHKFLMSNPKKRQVVDWTTNPTDADQQVYA